MTETTKEQRNQVRQLIDANPDFGRGYIVSLLADAERLAKVEAEAEQMCRELAQSRTGVFVSQEIKRRILDRGNQDE